MRKETRERYRSRKKVKREKGKHVTVAEEKQICRLQRGSPRGERGPLVERHERRPGMLKKNSVRIPYVGPGRLT